MKNTVEKEMIEVQNYGLTVIVEDEHKSEKVHAMVSLIDSEDHMKNFQQVSLIADSGIASVNRHLSNDEKDKIYDLNINGQFKEAEKMEADGKATWEIEFLKHAS